ncbi:hypothetical protein D3C87_1334380 [compost metagenome]
MLFEAFKVFKAVFFDKSTLVIKLFEMFKVSTAVNPSMPVRFTIELLDKSSVVIVLILELRTAPFLPSLSI